MDTCPICGGDPLHYEHDATCQSSEPKVEIGCHERIAGALLDFVGFLTENHLPGSRIDFLWELKGWAKSCDLTLDDAWVDGRWVQETFRHALVMDPDTTKEQLHHWLCEVEDGE